MGIEISSSKMRPTFEQFLSPKCGSHMNNLSILFPFVVTEAALKYINPKTSALVGEYTNHHASQVVHDQFVRMSGMYKITCPCIKLLHLS